MEAKPQNKRDSGSQFLPEVKRFISNYEICLYVSKSPTLPRLIVPEEASTRTGQDEDHSKASLPGTASFRGPRTTSLPQLVP